MDKLPKSQHPLAAVHPRALRACVFCSRLRAWCVWGMLIGLGLVPGILGIWWMLAFHLKWPSSVFRWLLSAAFLCLFGSSLGTLVITLIRTAIVALFFTRYSLAHLLGLVLSIGACGTAIVKLSGVWMLFPVAGLCTLAVLVFYFISDQDPEGPAQTPAFLRAALQRRNRISQPEVMPHTVEAEPEGNVSGNP